MPQLMDRRFTDLEVESLATIAHSMRSDYPDDDDRWQGSPFAWIKKRPSRQVGAIGERLVEEFFATQGFDVDRSPDSDADRVISGIRVEIKFSTLWKNDLYKFQQIRDQNYSALICLGVGPFSAHCWTLRKSEVMENWGVAGRLPHQHGGQSGQDTAWLSVDPANVPVWLRPYGDTLADATRILKRMSNTPERA